MNESKAGHVMAGWREQINFYFSIFFAHVTFVEILLLLLCCFAVPRYYRLTALGIVPNGSMPEAHGSNLLPLLKNASKKRQ